MPIFYDAKKQLFHLSNDCVSYVLQVSQDGRLSHKYWGKKLRAFHESAPHVFMDRAFSPNPTGEDRTFSLDNLPQEYPAYGNGDFRVPAFEAAYPNGSTVTDLRCCAHRIIKGKPKLQGLPATYTESPEEAETLELTMQDTLSGLEAVLLYTIFTGNGAIARSVRFVNRGKKEIRLNRVLSASVDFTDDQFDLLTLDGAHANERNIARRPLAPGTQLVDSCRGASSHQHNPFFALLRKNTGEASGEAYSMNLVYSGNFLAEVQTDQFHTARMNIGINPFDFSWLLKPGEEFQSPEAVLVYSDKGLDGMSQIYHPLYRRRLCRGKFRDAQRPVLINSWEAAYFNFNEDSILKLASEAAKVGIELLVLDDGWFGRRDDDNSSLGDWVVNRKKLPGGLAGLGEKTHRMGLKFGIWLEPEMVSEDSNLYRTHPEWCLHVNGRVRSKGRNQLVLDLSRKDVCHYITDAVEEVLSSAPIDYVKWDMNRHMTEVGSALLPPERQRETAHRYMLGLYQVLEEITSRFPDILFESCSGGGGRFDPGFLYYMPQTWASDNTDAVCRQKIEYATSLVYPPITIGSHVSASPNEQVGRIAPLSTRGLTAMSGCFGYELDLGQLTEQEREEIRRQVQLYKELRPMIQFGTQHRLLSPFEGNEAAWLFLSQDQSDAAVFYFKVLAEPAAPVHILRLRDLDPSAQYQDTDTKAVYGGDELMYAGLTVPPVLGDFTSRLWRFHQV
ncbi:MAG: alpha-galactosidase [Oscillospiraceae bacterium]|jgi:alpha-galactosidase|nr:alpha-galactosidase [Oscillospiraceae bacterium]